MKTRPLHTEAQPVFKGAPSLSPARLLLVVAVSVMTIETAVMFLFELLPPMSPLFANFADGVLLTILLFPILYLFQFRPANAQLSALAQTETTLRQQNEELREKSLQLVAAQAERMRAEQLALLGQIADTVGHELRNPLGVMNNAVFFLQTTLTDTDATTTDYLGIIKDEIVDAERIVSDLLDAVRTRQPQPETVELAGLVRRTLRKCKAPPSITVRLDIPENISPVRADPAQMQHVLWNLFCNGGEAMPEGGVLEISADEDLPMKTVTVRIKDSGIGIAPENMGKLFQPMFTTKARRIGLGLAVVKNLTRANGGSVGVESEAGKGSTFSVTLPSGEL